jgi:hypothetical protein
MRRRMSAKEARAAPVWRTLSRRWVTIWVSDSMQELTSVVARNKAEDAGDERAGRKRNGFAR